MGSVRSEPVRSAAVRSGSLRHLPAILIVLVLSFPGTGTSFGEACRFMSSVLPDLRRAVVEGRVLVAGGGRAFLWLEVDGARRWYLRYVASLPRGHGVGTVLLQEALSRADAHAAVVVLHCPRARARWYRRHGFLPAPATREARDRASVRAGCVKLRRRPATRRGRLVAPSARVPQAAGAAANCVA